MNGEVLLPQTARGIKKIERFRLNSIFPDIGQNRIAEAFEVGQMAFQYRKDNPSIDTFVLIHDNIAELGHLYQRIIQRIVDDRIFFNPSSPKFEEFGRLAGVEMALHA